MNSSLLNLIEALIFESASLALEDKQALLSALPKLTEEKLLKIKQVFEQEKAGYETVQKQKIMALEKFNFALETVTTK